jgi:plastocyanin
MMKRRFIISSLGVWLLVCAGSVFAHEIIDIEIKDFRFTPATISISPGTTVRWTNREKRQYHSVWFEALGEKEPDYLFPDDSYERVFENKGNFPYRCGPHPEMQGVVHVE